MSVGLFVRVEPFYGFLAIAVRRGQNCLFDLVDNNEIIGHVIFRDEDVVLLPCPFVEPFRIESVIFSAVRAFIRWVAVDDRIRRNLDRLIVHM